MARNQLTFAIFSDILETASLYLAEPDERTDDLGEDGLKLRPEYGGRFWTSGFGIVVEDATVIYRFLAAAGIVFAEREAREQDGFDVDALARATATDSMGHGTIAYWNDWEVIDLPDTYKD